MPPVEDSSPEELPLPPNFRSIDEILNPINNEIKNGIFVNVIGYIKAVKAPIATRGSDWKAIIEIVDFSNQFEGIEVNIFWPEEKIPKTSRPGQIVLIRNAKVQTRFGQLSLLANYASQFHLFTHLPGSGSFQSSWQSWPSATGSPNSTETAYAIWVSSKRKEIELPTELEFHQHVEKSIRAKDKFSLLKDVKPDHFYNIMGEVAKIFDSPGKIQLYISDYTPNSLFFNYEWAKDGENSDGQDGDEYGYTKSKKKNKEEWPGPFGKLVIQLTLFDPHDEFVRKNVIVKDWVLLSNVQIKHVMNGSLLEGVLRTDQRFPGKIQVRVMESAGDPAETDPRWKAAMQRKLDWQKKFKGQIKSILDEDAETGTKRKVESEEPLAKNSKQRKKEKRAAGLQKAARIDAKNAEKLDLNQNIKCGFLDQPIVSFKELLRPHVLIQTEVGSEIVSPFTLAKYRVIVRVVDYFPPKIEDFTVGRRKSEMEILSDYSGGEDTDLEEDGRVFQKNEGSVKNIWEWRFALQVEDASCKDSNERLWLMVDNHSAQGLLGLDDNATNLRANPTLLSKLKEQLFKLWGDLEERKSAIFRQQNSSATNDLPPSSFNSLQSSPPQRFGQQPDVDSEDDIEDSNSTVLNELNPKIPLPMDGSMAELSIAPKNKAFMCCIKQYGVKVDEDDPTKANAGNGQRWQRNFGLFGARIM